MAFSVVVLISNWVLFSSIAKYDPNINSILAIIRYLQNIVGQFYYGCIVIIIIVIIILFAQTVVGITCNAFQALDNVTLITNLTRIVRFDIT